MMLLWRLGHASATQIIVELASEKFRAHTTVATFLERMAKKGHLKVDRSAKAHIFTPAISYEQGIAAEAAYVLDKHFQADPKALAILARAIARHPAMRGSQGRRKPAAGSTARPRTGRRSGH